ncbi:NADPH:quinone reductase [Arthrobacter sp. SDTb3-6]|uniref:NADPH:quinone reductase n=1 Tax=Arthrobacter sp. SDTb3-6 TaxID=2713571 RepID=UPI001C3FF84A|nr:NADPH:quinone reductase [Arthrobacter sp. SDTb3-6]
MAQDMMDAAYFRHTGGSDVIEFGPLPVPQLPDHAVLVRVAATAVNHVDTFVRSGGYATALSFPQAIGRDATGTVERVGAAVDAPFRPGDPVWSNSLGFGGRSGAGAAFTVVPADRLYPLPAGVDPVEAAAVLHAGATAWLALHRHAGVQPGDTVFVGGGTGQVGSALVVQAVRAGARVITSSSADDAGHCRSLGATATLDYRSPALMDELAAAARSVSGGRGLDVHIETSGRHQLEAAVEMLALRGRIIALSGMAATNALPLGRLYTRDGSVHGFAISNATVGELADAARAVNELLADGSLRARHITRLPLSGAAGAHAAMEAGTARGKLVLIP